MNTLLQSNPAPANQAPRLLDQVRDLAHVRGHCKQTAQSFVDWSRRFILFHDKRHPEGMGPKEIARFGTRRMAEIVSKCRLTLK